MTCGFPGTLSGVDEQNAQWLSRRQLHEAADAAGLRPGTSDQPLAQGAVSIGVPIRRPAQRR